MTYSPSMWAVRPSQHILREVTDFGLGKIATVSTRLDERMWLVLSERISHNDPELVDWNRMIDELFADGQIVEAQ